MNHLKSLRGLVTKTLTSALVLVLVMLWTAEHRALSACPYYYTVETAQSFAGIQIPDLSRGVGGNWVSDLQGATGTSKSFTATTSSTVSPPRSLPTVNVYVRLPAEWNTGETDGPCAGRVEGPDPLGNGSVVQLVCVFTDPPSFSASPSSWYNNQSADVTITGSDISLSAITYIVDNYGNLQATYSGAVNSTTVYLSNLTLPNSGTYYAVVENPNGDGTYTPIGSVALDVLNCGNGCDAPIR